VRYNRAGDVSRANGRKGGRPRLKPEQLELRELCKRQTAAAFERLKHLAFHGELDTTQHAALCTLLAYGHGKLVQAVGGPDGGNVILQVITGVNTPDDFGQ
jgi:hypothetical protein